MSANHMRTGSVGALVLGLMMITSGAVNTQIQHTFGQNVVPVFEGWERMADGSFDMVFGYMNRNYEEEVDVPIGDGNSFEPGVDHGQPTHFYTRRQQYVFRVSVPKDWGKKELVWTMTSHGRTEKAYGTLVAFSEISPLVIQENRGGPPDEAANQPPSIKMIGAAERTVRVSGSLLLSVDVTDDGHPVPRVRSTAARSGAGRSAIAGPPNRRESPIGQAIVKLDPGVRLGVTWVFYRGGPGTIAFDPMRAAVVDGKATTNARFSKPGTYQVRAYADDGVLVTPADVKVIVTGNTQPR
jgi:hypothetical protein